MTHYLISVLARIVLLPAYSREGLWTITQAESKDVYRPWFYVGSVSIERRGIEVTGFVVILWRRKVSIGWIGRIE